MEYTIKLYSNEIEDYSDRYVIIDSKGLDVIGEHMSLDEVLITLKDLIENDVNRLTEED
jgi:hypothetical protein